MDASQFSSNAKRVSFGGGSLKDESWVIDTGKVRKRKSLKRKRTDNLLMFVLLCVEHMEECLASM